MASSTLPLGSLRMNDHGYWKCKPPGYSRDCDVKFAISSDDTELIALPSKAAWLPDYIQRYEKTLVSYTVDQSGQYNKVTIYHDALVWNLLHLWPDFVTYADEMCINRVLTQIRAHDLCEVALMQLLWAKKGEPGFQYLRIPTSVKLQQVCKVIGEIMTPTMKLALRLWATYEPCDGNQNARYRADTAIRVSSTAFPEDPTGAGIQKLLEHNIFTKVKDTQGRWWYQTPKIISAEEVITTVLRHIQDQTSRRDFAGTEIDHGFNTKQQRAADMLRDPRIGVCLLLGRAGTGKTRTAACELKTQQELTAAFTPTLKAKNILERNLSRAGFEDVAVDVFHALPWMFKEPAQHSKRKRDPETSDRVILNSKRGSTFAEKLGFAINEDHADNGEIIRTWVHTSEFKKVKVLLIEECGMWSTEDLGRTLRVCKTFFPCVHKIIFSGDCNQLLPIERGAVLEDLMKAGLPYVQLTEVMRSTSALASNASAILDKQLTQVQTDQTFEVITCSSFQKITQDGKTKLLPLKEMIDVHWLQDKHQGEEAHILCPINTECYAINKYIAETLDLKNRTSNVVALVKGLKVQILSNDYMESGVFKRDLFIIQDIAEIKGENKSAAMTQLCLEPWETCRNCRMVESKERCEYCVPKTIAADKLKIAEHVQVAYATTIFTAQGGEAEYIYPLAIPDNCVYTDRYGLYTSMTRAQTRCKVFTQKGGLSRVINNTHRDDHPRQSILYMKVQEKFPRK